MKTTHDNHSSLPLVQTTLSLTSEMTEFSCKSHKKASSLIVLVLFLVYLTFTFELPVQSLLECGTTTIMDETRMTAGASNDKLVQVVLGNESQTSYCTSLLLDQHTNEWKQKIPNIISQREAYLQQRIQKEQEKFNATTTSSSALLLPSVEHPFVFFHVRKAGGSTIRHRLYDVSQNFSLPHWIPCFGIPCPTYRIPHTQQPPFQKHAIYGAHLWFDDVESKLSKSAQKNQLKILKQQQHHPQNNRNGIVMMKQEKDQQQQLQRKEQEESQPSSSSTQVEQPPFDCLVNIRSTVSRVVSCWNYRFGGLDGNLTKHDPTRAPWFVPSYEMTPDQWDSYLPNAYSEYGEGCNNELMRVFGTVDGNDIMINTFLTPPTKTGRQHQHSNDTTTTTAIPSEHSSSSSSSLSTLQQCFDGRSQLDIILSRISQCVVMVSDRNRSQDNKLVLEHYFPWWTPFLEQEFASKPITNNNSTTAEKGGGEGESGEMVKNAGKIKAKTLVEGSEEVILDHNQLDEQVYQFGLALFEEQVNIAKAAKQAKLLEQQQQQQVQQQQQQQQPPRDERRKRRKL